MHPGPTARDTMELCSKYHNYFTELYNPTENWTTQVRYSPKAIDVSTSGPYSNYNRELFFHIPLMVATHLSKNQRFAEAQRWFHDIFLLLYQQRPERRPVAAVLELPRLPRP